MFKVSIVTVSLNAKKEIQGTIESVLSQTYPLIEYYEKKNNLVKIEVSNLTADEVFEEVKKVIK